VTPGGDPDGLLLGTGATSPGGTAAAASLGGFLLLGAVLVPLYSYRKRWIEQQGEPEDDESQGGYEIAYLGQASWVEACSVLPSSPTSSKADLTAGHEPQQPTNLPNSVMDELEVESGHVPDSSHDTPGEAWAQRLTPVVATDAVPIPRRQLTADMREQMREQMRRRMYRLDSDSIDGAVPSTEAPGSSRAMEQSSLNEWELPGTVRIG